MKSMLTRIAALVFSAALIVSYPLDVNAASCPGGKHKALVSVGIYRQIEIKDAAWHVISPYTYYECDFCKEGVMLYDAPIRVESHTFAPVSKYHGGGTNHYYSDKCTACDYENPQMFAVYCAGGCVSQWSSPVETFHTEGDHVSSDVWIDTSADGNPVPPTANSPAQSGGAYGGDRAPLAHTEEDIDTQGDIEESGALHEVLLTNSLLITQGQHQYKHMLSPDSRCSGYTMVLTDFRSKDGEPYYQASLVQVCSDHEAEDERLELLFDSREDMIDELRLRVPGLCLEWSRLEEGSQLVYFTCSYLCPDALADDTACIIEKGVDVQ